MSSQRLSLLGTPELSADGQPVAISRRKAFALLAFLAVTGTAHRRESLATLLWPDYDTSRARGYLRRELFALNQALGDGVLHISHGRIELTPDNGPTVDTRAFRRALAACRDHDHPPDKACPECRSSLTLAAEIYRGDFLSGFTLPDSAAFDDWQFFQAEGLRRDLASALDRLALLLASLGEMEEAILHARRRLALDPLHEPAHQHLMQLYAWSGQQAAALRQFDECAALLASELDVTPDDHTITLCEQVRTRQLPAPMLEPGDAPEMRAQETAALPSASRVDAGAETRSPMRRQLPRQATQFIGRSSELAEIRRLLTQENGCRLLTIVGPGGIGKTRLAIQAASDTEEGFADGVCFVDLAAISGAEYLVAAVADALHLSLPGSSDPMQQLRNYLKETDLLLVLDNYEHLLPDVQLIIELLSHTPTRLLATSRERLNLQEEWILPLTGLQMPGNEENRGSIAQSEAVELFVQRITRKQPGFELTPENGSAVVEICNLVAGMPLGLELAAAWGNVLTCDEIAREIRGGIDFLATSGRDVAQRHRTLRAVFEQSWELLVPHERVTFARLSVFQGSFQRRAAERVAEATLMQLSDLIDKSLVRRTRNGRYTIHELLRQFAAEKLAELPQAESETLHRHTNYFADLLQRHLPDLKGEGQVDALAGIGAELDNIRSAWQRMSQQRNVDAIGRSAEALMEYYEMSGRLQEGDESFATAANQLAGNSSPDREHALAAHKCSVYQAWFKARQGEFAQAKEHFLQANQRLETLHFAGDASEALFSLWYGCMLYMAGDNDLAAQKLESAIALFDEHNETFEIGKCTAVLGMIQLNLTRLEDARRSLERGRDLLATARETRYQAFCHSDLAMIAVQEGDFDLADQLAARALFMRRTVGDKIGTAFSNSVLGYVKEATGDFARAEQHHEEAIAMHKQMGNERFRCFCCCDQAIAILAKGEMTQTRELCEESLRTFQRLEEPIGIASAQYALAEFDFASGNFDTAYRLHESALDMRRGLGNRHHIALSLNGVGRAANALGHEAVARQAFGEALAVGRESGLKPVMLDAILGLAELGASAATEFENGELALPIFVGRHPACPASVRQRAQRLVAEKRQALSQESVERIFQETQNLELTEVASRLLAR